MLSHRLLPPLSYRGSRSTKKAVTNGATAPAPSAVVADAPSSAAAGATQALQPARACGAEKPVAGSSCGSGGGGGGMADGSGTSLDHSRVVMEERIMSKQLEAPPLPAPSSPALESSPEEPIECAERAPPVAPPRSRGSARRSSGAASSELRASPPHNGTETSAMPLQALGPYKPVEIAWGDLLLNTLDIMAPQGGSYSVELESTCLAPHVRPHFEDSGSLSPAHTISHARNGSLLRIPEAATHYAYAYPLPGSGTTIWPT